MRSGPGPRMSGRGNGDPERVAETGDLAGQAITTRYIGLRPVQISYDSLQTTPPEVSVTRRSAVVTAVLTGGDAQQRAVASVT